MQTPRGSDIWISPSEQTNIPRKNSPEIQLKAPSSKDKFIKLMIKTCPTDDVTTMAD